MTLHLTKQNDTNDVKQELKKKWTVIHALQSFKKKNCICLYRHTILYSRFELNDLLFNINSHIIINWSMWCVLYLCACVCVCLWCLSHYLCVENEIMNFCSICASWSFSMMRFIKDKTLSIKQTHANTSTNMRQFFETILRIISTARYYRCIHRLVLRQLSWCTSHNVTKTERKIPLYT